MASSNSKVWLITGAGTGLGKAVVQHALAQGDKVSATARRTALLDDLVAKYSSSQLIVVKLDVTSDEEIKAAFQKTVEAFGRVDVVYNNAAQGSFGEFEGANMDDARKYFDVNFWGAVSVSKEAVRVFRDVNKPAGGVLLQASSAAGLTGMPVMGFYCASKFALDGISEALSKELDPSWNIRVKILVIASIDTKGLARVSALIPPLHSAYESLPDTSVVKGTRRLLTGEYQPEGDPAKAARAIFDISKDEKLEPIRVPLGHVAVQILDRKIEEYKAVIEKAGKYSEDLKYTK